MRTLIALLALLLVAACPVFADTDGLSDENAPRTSLDAVSSDATPSPAPPMATLTDQKPRIHLEALDPHPPTPFPEYMAHAFMLAALMKGDVELENAVQRNNLPFLSNKVADGLFQLGDGGVDLAIAEGMRVFGNDKAKEAGAAAIRAVLNAGANVQVLKTLFGRGNPEGGFGQPAEFTGPRLEPGHDSFPSGHTASAVALATVLANYYPQHKFEYYALAGLTGISTVARHVHWWSDVYAGVLTGRASGLEALRRQPNLLDIKF